MKPQDQTPCAGLLSIWHLKSLEGKDTISLLTGGAYVGILLYEMLTGKPPFLGGKGKIQEKIVKDKIKLPKFLSSEAHALLKGLLQKEPERRMGSGPSGAEEIKQNKWFKGINWKKLEAREVVPSFKPDVSGRQCIENFDKCWTDMSVLDSPASSPNSDPFTNFSYVRPPPSFLHQTTSTL